MRDALCNGLPFLCTDFQSYQGSAMASLIHMQKILSNRMQHFSTPEKAVTNAQNFFPFCDSSRAHLIILSKFLIMLFFTQVALFLRNALYLIYPRPLPRPTKKRNLFCRENMKFSISRREYNSVVSISITYIMFLLLS